MQIGKYIQPHNFSESRHVSEVCNNQEEYEKGESMLLYLHLYVRMYGRSLY